MNVNVNVLVRISQLPKELQDIISTYNVEHRKQMKLVCQELQRVKCYYCNNYVNKINVVYNTTLFDEVKYCSYFCSYRHEHQLRQEYYNNHGY